MFRGKRKRHYAESTEQQAFFKALTLKYPWLKPYTFAIPNGGKRNPREARRLIAEGVLAGLPDVQVAYPSGENHGLFLEFKSNKGNLTQKQREVMFRLSSVGYRCYVVRSCIEALDRIEEYLLQLPNLQEINNGTST